MAATMTAVSAPAAAVALSKSEFVGTSVATGVPSLAVSGKRAPLSVRAGGGKKIQTKTPYGPSGSTKFKSGADASGSKAKGKGVYQFAKKYGANVDGYSPIWEPSEWSASGDVYAPGPSGLTLWAVTLGAVLLGGVLLVYNTSALVN